MNRIVADGRERLREAQLDLIMWELTQEHADELRHATVWQRWFIHQRLQQEAERRLLRQPQPSAETVF
jgi:hypothetical protein